MFKIKISMQDLILTSTILPRLSTMPSSLSTQINLCIILTLFIFTGESQTSIINPERSILVDLRKHFSNPPNISHWTSSSDHCTWPEITCRNSVVTGIQLDWLLISDTIPPFICDLKNLTFLDLNHNLIPGSFPKSLYNCSNLEYLDLSFNSFNGIIPDDISRLSPRLEVLNLSSNWFVGGIPAGIADLKGLKQLQLAGVVTNGSFPSEIGYLLNLEVLDLSQNSFSPQEIPPSFTQLKKLRNLWINQANLIGEIPGNIGNMIALEFLDLSVNNISGSIPVGLGRLPALRNVWLYTNNLSGTIPDSLWTAGNLTMLLINNNQLTGQLSQKVASNLVTINISNNRLSGEIPDGLWTAGLLVWLLIKNNQFTGQLPQKIASNVFVVDISNNWFSGKIPPAISSWSNLDTFRASNNLLTGKIPQEITALTSLSVLMLDGNKLSGTIHPALSLLANLDQLDLSDNQFSGEIPPGVASLKPTSLNLSSNHLSGKIPDEFEVTDFRNSFLNNPELCATTPSLGLKVCREKTNKSRVIAIAGILFLVGILYTVYVFKIRRMEEKKRKKTLVQEWKLTPFHTLSFTESDILQNLAEDNIVGSGGSGKVYVVPFSSEEKVAVKRIWNKQKPDKKLEKQFLAEVEILGTIRHSNIVKLWCCISSEESNLLVYEYMDNRSLDLWLYAKRRPPGQFLDWPTRLHIAIGAAQGLSYMHHNCSTPIVHRDMKSSNVLLDYEFNAKIADFGLARILMKRDDPNTVSTIAGSFGYIAPEYARTRKVSEKIDVYSFGVILLELVTGREPIDGDMHYGLADWARRHVEEGNPIVDAVDGDIKDPKYSNEMCGVFRLGMFCTGANPTQRPTMRNVLQILLHYSPPSPN